MPQKPKQQQQQQKPQYLSTTFIAVFVTFITNYLASENSFKPLALQKSAANLFCLAGENLKLVPC